MKLRSIAVATLVVFVCLSITACDVYSLFLPEETTSRCEELGHVWMTATCTAPKTCSVCSVTEGESLAHKWNAPSCSAPKTCSVCFATEGEALAHTWVAATYTLPKTCSVCSATEGEPLANTGSEVNAAFYQKLQGYWIFTNGNQITHSMYYDGEKIYSDYYPNGYICLNVQIITQLDENVFQLRYTPFCASCRDPKHPSTSTVDTLTFDGDSLYWNESKYHRALSYYPYGDARHGGESAKSAFLRKLTGAWSSHVYTGSLSVMKCNGYNIFYGNSRRGYNCMNVKKVTVVDENSFQVEYIAGCDYCISQGVIDQYYQYVESFVFSGDYLYFKGEKHDHGSNDGWYPPH